jgi:hypothetical protein
MNGQDRISTTGPHADGAYVVEFWTAAGETVAIPIPRDETSLIEYFQKRMSNGLVIWAP